MKKQAIAVIDLSNSTLSVHDVDSSLDSEGIEDALRELGYHLSNCSWGAFDGVVLDYREHTHMICSKCLEIECDDDCPNKEFRS